MRTPVAAVALMLAIAVGLVACGDDSNSTSASAPKKCAQPAVESTANTGATDPMLEEIQKRGKPTVELPADPATKLEVKDQVEGTGKAAEATSTVTVHYVGCGQVSGKQFDASWDHGQPATFGLNQVIQGWSQGLVGMKEGGRRELTIPGELAYGTNPPPGSGIQPNETLVFVVDMISVQ